MKVLLTGATGAIGREIATRLAANGDSVILGCRSQKKASELASEIKQNYGISPAVLIIDLSDSASVRNAVKNIANERLDGVIHNAGVMNSEYHKGPDGREETINVNYHNTRLLTELLLPNLNAGACVVFTTSATRGWYPFQKITDDIPPSKFNRLKTYALSKKLITAYAGKLSKELKEKGIRVNCTDPGVVDTPMLSMGKWFDKLTDIFFRPLCFSPKLASKTAIRALKNRHTGYIFLTPWGMTRINAKVFISKS